MDPDRLKYLEFLQAVITRHANNSFLIKGWSLTIVSAFFGLAIAQHSAGLALVALLPIGGFAWLDAYFLRQERLFRHLYNAAIDPEAKVSMFAMDTTGFQEVASVRWSSVLRSSPFQVFHGTILLVGIVLIGWFCVALIVDCVANHLPQIIQHLSR